MISQKPPDNQQKVKNHKPPHQLVITVVEEDNKRNVVLVINACTQGQDCSIQHLKPQNYPFYSKQVRIEYRPSMPGIPGKYEI